MMSGLGFFTVVDEYMLKCRCTDNTILVCVAVLHEVIGLLYVYERDWLQCGKEPHHTCFQSLSLAPEPSNNHTWKSAAEQIHNDGSFHQVSCVDEVEKLKI